MKETWEKILQFFREVRVEIKKVTWPTRKETLASTVVVLITTFVISAFLGVVDFLLSSGVELILKS
ncbi:MAG: preprotein translocase subunit SecE [Deltaproteobacteria bacterium]|nr:preprotein translocase subunit SecE [Candidatus Zymogenaceae bacterium]